jgi:hypothetical protein
MKNYNMKFDEDKRGWVSIRGTNSHIVIAVIIIVTIILLLKILIK